MNHLRAWVPALLPLSILLAWKLLGASGASLLPPLWGTLVLLSLWIGWHRQEALRFRAWFREKKTRIPPLSSGIWEETFAEGYHWRRHQEQRQHTLNQQIMQLRDALQALPDALLLMDDEGRLLWMNPAAVSLLHLHWPEDLGKPLSFWLRMPQMQEFLAGAGPSSMAMEFADRPNAAFEVLRYPLGSAGALVLFRDVTRLRQLEQVRQDFVANVSHELRSPLTVIRGFLENLLDSPLAQDAEVGPQLRLMEEQGQRMQSLVEDLLSLARVESAEPDPQRCENIFVAQLVERARESLMATILDKELALHLELDLGLAVFAEPLDISGIVQNLLENAVKYCPRGRDIFIAWGEEEGSLVLRVRDTGEGIPEEHLQRITERFYRVDKGRSRRIGGTGLGLSIVRHSAERYGGRLQVRSVVGQGSEFVVFLPAELARRGNSWQD
ncbi:phosphate regulon sensor histidine kinase PhoR [Candidatus Igneacidithiobacillus taiwanensis]|uniref:phosphate regulon sensor histidine kinase PhoR n=1 Tax=Candidatus Igneacidithiobacillus taiwanensis TaxID=1945924 RepID=UPI00289E5787|nr:phosphate regulon sensor histidine kinase PhoR [Candidatus Igneacidithiobacillus taiwanensis]MCE5360224.1 phosphate regulon sensor histidine kinase PhoR [Acidithiobacillus sp.]